MPSKQGYETYELAGYYFLEHAHYSGLAPGTKPFLFFTGPYTPGRIG